jgi:hypothetical protein
MAQACAFPPPFFGDLSAIAILQQSMAGYGSTTAFKAFRQL